MHCTSFSLSKQGQGISRMKAEGFPGFPQSSLTSQFVSRIETLLGELVGRRALTFLVVLRNGLIRSEIANSKQNPAFMDSFIW